MKIIKKSCVNKETCNSNNHYEYNPYCVNNSYVEIDKEWFDSLTIKTQKRIKQSIDFFKFNIVFKKINMPHDNFKELEKENNDKKLRVLYNIYYAYLHQYDYESWYNDLDMDVDIIEIKKRDLKILYEISMVRTIKNPSSVWIEDKFDDISKELKNKIEVSLKKYGNNCFVKTNKTSGKNETMLTPKHTLNDVIMHITSCREYMKEYKFILEDYRFDYTQCLIIMPWNASLNRSREFRVIVINKEIRCISQQKWFEKTTLTEDQLTKIGYAILNKFDKIKSKIKFNDVTIDLWVDDDFIVHIIELNPGGNYSSSGSSLFHWIDDYDKIYKSNDVYLKYF